jgi:outer membrane protein assembly factor BamE
MRPLFPPRRFFPAFFAAGSLAGLLAGCSFDSIVSKVDPYRIDIRQGNHVDQTMAAQLKRGMTREQVRFVLGSPLVNDVFRNDRWDYVYRFKPGKGEVQQRVLSVFFVDDRLDRLAGNVVAGDVAAMGQAEQERVTRTIDIPPAPAD